MSILGEAAAVKALEYVVQILRGNAAAVVGYPELHGGGQSAPFDAYSAALIRVVKRVFYKVADGFDEPIAVAEK